MKILQTALALLWFVSLSTGCTPQSGPKEPAAPLSAAALGKLAAADKADGKEDKLVSKCPACMLNMDGDAKHSSQIEGYTVHSCHQACAEALEKDPEAVLARLP